MRRLIEDLLAEQTGLTRAVMDFAGRRRPARTPAARAVRGQGWAALHAEAAKACEAALRRVEARRRQLELRQADHRRRGAAGAGRRRRDAAAPCAKMTASR